MADEVTSATGQRLVRMPRDRRAAAEPDPAFHSAEDAVPPETTDPAFRERPTISAVTLTDDARTDPYDPDAPPDAPPEPAADWDGKFRSLEDLNYVFPFDNGTGQYFVTVMRKQPKAWDGMSTYGRQRNIQHERLSYHEFVAAYGGGQYELMVYGPPKRGREYDRNGQLVPKPLLKAPISLTVPWMGDGGVSPNPDSAAIFEGQTQAMPATVPGDIPSALMSSRIRNSADANIYKEHVQHEQWREERAEERRERQRERVRSDQLTQGELLTRAHKQAVDLLTEQLHAAQEEARALRQQKPSSTAELGQLLAMVQRPPSEQELERMRSSHKNELERTQEAHRRELEVVTAKAVEDLRRAEERGERHTADLTRRYEDEVRRLTDQLKVLEERLVRERDADREQHRRDTEHLQAEHKREVTYLQAEHDRVLTAQRQHFEARLSDEQRANERDRALRGELTNSQIAVERARLETDAKNTERRNAELVAENQRLRSELDKKGDLGRQIKVITENAALLGMRRDEGGDGGEAEEGNWKTMLGKVGLGFVQQLPQIIENASKAVSQVRTAAPAGPPAPPPAQGQFGGPRAAPLPPTSAPIVPPFYTEEFAHTAPPLPAAFQGAPGPYGYPTSPAPSGPSAPPPAQSAAPPAQPAGAPPAAPEPPAINDAQVLEYRPHLEAALSSGVPPEEVAADLVRTYPAEAVKGIASLIGPDLVAAVLQRNNLGTSPLVRRDGQRFLAKLQSAILAA